MGVYDYRALTADGREISGTLEFAEEGSVLSHLERQGYIPLDIELRADQESASGERNASAREYRRFSVLEFTRGLGVLLRAGLPVDKALASLSSASPESRTRRLIDQLIRDIREGSSLSKALLRFEGVFGRLYISLIQAGEISGNLEASIERLGDYLERQSQLRERIVNAAIYPLILTVVTIVSIAVLMTVVMPRFRQLFEDMNAELPAVTRVFLGASDFLQQYGTILATMLFCMILGALLARRNGEIAARIDRWIIGLPVVGGLAGKLQIARYAETLSMMLKCGIPIQKSLLASTRVVTNRWIREQLSEAAGEIREGGSFSNAIGRHFPALTQQILKVGERAGDLDNSLEKISSMIQHDVNRSIQRAIGIFEPLVIVVLGLIVAGVIGSVMVAVLGMNDLISA